MVPAIVPILPVVHKQWHTHNVAVAADLEMEIANIMVRRLKHKPFRRIPLDMTMTGIWYLPVPGQEAY